jgi:hypothetical protein
MQYEFIIDLRTHKDFYAEYSDILQNINEHIYINKFYIPTKEDFLNKYNTFWSAYKITENNNIDIKNAIVYI